MMINEPRLIDYMSETQEEHYRELEENLNKSERQIRTYNFLNQLYYCYLEALELYRWENQNK